ncbi:hypothetical protein C8F04DRAFT_1237698 [Mycena alexandri]|uniref:Uncharacterized protein n=1 Tax=Mycena alexandri TaxID=1745969 RepID=A0AAD6WXD0_9AGAR|nr:hypothetical protein C8F04DRAFT_1237698 [Mycena alexandri]
MSATISTSFNSFKRVICPFGARPSIKVVSNPVNACPAFSLTRRRVGWVEAKSGPSGQYDLNFGSTNFFKIYLDLGHLPQRLLPGLVKGGHNSRTFIHVDQELSNMSFGGRIYAQLNPGIQLQASFNVIQSPQEGVTMLFEPSLSIYLIQYPSLNPTLRCHVPDYAALGTPFELYFKTRTLAGCFPMSGT